VLLSLIQTLGTGDEGGIAKFVYGQTAAMATSDALAILVVAVLAVLASAASSRSSASPASTRSSPGPKASPPTGSTSR
jgi:hypothetical protein